MKIFFISPVRQATKEIIEACERYVIKLENDGHQVHYPRWHTDQTDPIGINICDTNLKKILEADEVHIWYLSSSTGIHFDLGAVYMLRFLGYEKEIVFVSGSKEEFEANYVSRIILESVAEMNRLSICYDKQDMPLHFMLGAAYLSIRILGRKKRVIFANRDDFRDEFTLENNEFIAKGGKSYLNVLNYLDKTT